jgi:hypothetical protein
MTYYLAVHPNPDVQLATIWTLDEKLATRIDARQVNNVVSGTPPNVVVDGLPGYRFFPLKLAAGEYYLRMARTTHDRMKESPGFHPGNTQYSELIETSRGQLVALREQLERIFRTVHPVPANYGAYGHDIRNLLILAATEVEAHWKGVLTANGVAGGNTNDYVKLLPAMKLDEYALRLPFYPWLPEVAPFSGWSSTAPTRSLSWYDAYNAVKHDREKEFQRGTLLHTLEAVCGCAVMIFAQFGVSGSAYRAEISTFFEIAASPKWDPSEVYWMVRSGATKAVPYPF